MKAGKYAGVAVLARNQKVLEKEASEPLQARKQGKSGTSSQKRLRILLQDTCYGKPITTLLLRDFELREEDVEEFIEYCDGWINAYLNFRKRKEAE